MNSASACHEIPDCPGLYVDAFRGHYLKRTHDPNNTFILSHYHGDHYGNLPREGKYQGPALIHCTPVTAALLRQVHEVPDVYLIEHSYGDSWSFRLKGAGASTVRITFYDANHCPGAAIILIEMPDEKVHLHTGDMRYHEKMKSYPLLKEAALNRKIDIVLLDTTYGNPKHDFVPQETAVDSIASQVTNLFEKDQIQSMKTLILLSCYSIGKEKVLWEASTRTNQMVYVTEKKLRMLKCVEGHDDVSSQICHRCTRNGDEADIHVVPMGLAGEMWPFFRANYWACADYANELTKKYNKVVAFIPTGWADSSNWNKKNGVSRMDCKGVEVEVRLISYSEHSAFSELKEFVNFLNPRKIIPTVFKDDNDARRIEARFKIDSSRAKQHFLRSMTARSSKVKSQSRSESSEVVGPEEKRDIETEDKLASLRSMGFDRFDAQSALKVSSGNLETAVEILLQKQAESSSGSDRVRTTAKQESLKDSCNKVQESPAQKRSRQIESSDSAPPPIPSKAMKAGKSHSIKNFFQVKRPVD